MQLEAWHGGGRVGMRVGVGGEQRRAEESRGEQSRGEERRAAESRAEERRAAESCRPDAGSRTARERGEQSGEARRDERRGAESREARHAAVTIPDDGHRANQQLPHLLRLEKGGMEGLRRGKGGDGLTSSCPTAANVGEVSAMQLKSKTWYADMRRATKP